MEVSFSPRARAVVIWVGVIAAAVLLLDAAGALQPFIWAIITAFILNPFVSFVHRRTHLPKHLITIWLYAMIALIITILIINFSAVVVEQVKGLQDQIPSAVDDVQVWLNDNHRDTLDRLGLDRDFVDQQLNSAAKPLADALGKAVIPVLFGTVTFAIELIIYLVASFYFIVQGDRFVSAARSLLHKRYHGEFDRLSAEISRTLGAYIRGQALLVAIMSTASFLMLTILGIQYAVIVALATGVLELIPLIGPWAAGAIAVSVALFQDGTPFGWSHLTLAIVLAIGYFALRQMEDAFVIPLVIGRIVHLHPLLVIFVIVVGTSLGGVLGLILAVPIAAVVKILSTYFYGKVMARETRIVEVVTSRSDLAYALERFPDRSNHTVVLMIEPNALEWSDLPLVQEIVDAAREHAVALSAVTPDGVAGTLFAAAGVPTTTVPIAVTAAEGSIA
jgi:predicted PurR-regulated permease PerM